MKGKQVDETNVRGMLASVDRMDPDEVASCFSEVGSFRFGNAEPVVGQSAIQEAQGAFFSTIDGLRHDTKGIWGGMWEQGVVYSVEAEATYTRKDSSEVKLPVTEYLANEGRFGPRLGCLYGHFPAIHGGRSCLGDASTSAGGLFTKARRRGVLGSSPNSPCE